MFLTKRKKRLGWNETFDNVKEAQDDLNSKLEERFKNSLDQNTQITDGVLKAQLGRDWKTFHELDFSNETFCLDNLDEPEKAPEKGGLLNPILNQEQLEVLKLSKNNLISLSCLNTRENGRLKFRRLRVLVASRNMLTEVRLELESLVVVNLSHNDLETLPSIKNLHLLERLLLSHNRIDGSLIDLASNRKLRVLDLSHNRFSWKPSLFKLQLDVLAQLHIEELRLGHNPFAECFSEYQFITVDRLDSITSLDGFIIDPDLMSDLRTKADELKTKNIDFSIFDVRVEDRRQNSARTEELGPVTGDGHVSTIHELVAVLGKALDHPSELVKHMDDFRQRVASVWTAFYRDRHKLMEMRDIKNEDEIEGAREQVVNEFADKMQQVLYRSDSVQKTCVTCLVQLLACDRLLGQRCARLLADWIDTSAGDLSSRIDDMSNALFKEIVDRVLPGMQSVCESPAECYEASQGNVGNHDWGNADSVAESATILEALSQFGPSTFYCSFEASLSSRMLQPLLPALCRPPRSQLGPEQPIDAWSEYRDFDAYPEDDIEPHEIQQTFLSKCRNKCQREGFGGFVTEENEDSPGWLYVHYKRKSPEALIGTRHRHEGRTLHVRPIPLPRSRPPIEQKYDVWPAWVNGLAVLVTATADKYNAAHCISKYSLHKVIIEHESNTSAGFTQAWLQVTPDAARAHTFFMQLARNLLNAAGEEAYIVAQYFEEHEFHKRCWNRLRPHLIEAGTGIPVVRLNEKPVNVKETISSLVSVACAMNTGDENDPVSDKIMGRLCKDGLDVYKALLEISAYPEVPDPLLLAASLEAVYMFLSNDNVRPQILTHTLNRLHDGAIVLPYIRGPRYNDQDNPKYQELWRSCELRYGPRTTTTYRALAASCHPGGSSAWKEHVPAFRDLRNPLMHRILLAIVKLIALFSIKAKTNDPFAQLHNVTNVLDNAGREDFLIGPASGLVTCPSFDIKIECMKCVSYILDAFPGQFDMEEMGWLMRGLSPVGIGVGKQEDFLMEVLGLVMLLVRNTGRTGALFRQKFAKHAVRESFEMLRVNCRREVQGSQEEEESKNDLSLKIVKLLHVCSGSVSSGLRKFLRRVDLLQGLQDVIIYEDRYEDPASASAGDPQDGCREALLRTWTGRDMRDVLWPLIVGNQLKPRGRSRYYTIRRLADVLQGRPDFQPDKATELESTDEALFWRGVTHMRRCLQQNDTEEDEDWKKQQETFVASDGISGLLGYAVRYLSVERFQGLFEKSQKEVQAFAEAARNNVLMTWWLDAAKANDDTAPDTAPAEVELSDTEKCCKMRLSIINQRVTALFAYNLSVYDENSNRSTLDTLSITLAGYFDDNQARHSKVRDQDVRACNHLESMPNYYLCDGRLMSLQEIVEEGRLFEKIKQPPVSDEETFRRSVVLAQWQLKRNVVQLNPPSNQVERWLQNNPLPGRVNRLDEGLARFLGNAQVLEVGMDIKELIESRKLRKQFQNSLGEKGQQKRLHEELTKMMNLASLTIEYPTIEDLSKSLKAMQTTTRFSILRIRNRFKKPTCLAERMVVVNVEILIEEHDKHIGELQLVVNEDLHDKDDGPVEHTERRRRAVLDDLEKALVESCGVRDRAAMVAEYLMYEMASRFIRHGDAVFIKSKSQTKHLEVSKNDVFAKETKLNTGQIFILERENGPGIIKSKDVVFLKARKTNCYVDVSANGQCRARFNDAALGQSQMKFVIEFNAYEQAMAGGEGPESRSMFGFNSGKLAKMPKRVRDRVGSSLQVSDQVKLRVKDTNTFLTVLPSTTYVALDARRKVKATGPGDMDEHQAFLVFQEGSMLDFLSCDAKAGAAPSEKTAEKPSDEDLEELLLRAHMCANLPALDASFQEGGLFRRAPPSFKTIAERLTEVDPELRERRADTGPVDANVRAEDRQFSLIVSAICRCAYVCCELPRSHVSQDYVLDELLNDPGATVNSPITRLVLVVMVAIRLQSTPGSEGASNFAGVPAKFLRLVSVVLANAPALSKPATHHAASTDYSHAEEEKREEQVMETGFYDKQRLIFMVIVMSFVREVLVGSLHARLAVVAQRGLNEEELVLLREFAAMMDNMILTFFGNELRCKLETRGEADDMLEDEARGRRNPSAQQALTDGTEAGAGAASEGGRRYGNGLMQSQRRTIFATLVSSDTIRILVHAMLYAMHQEAMAYKDATFHKADLTVRLVSSLVDRCISALCAAMYGCGDEEGACAYDICEVISQTMTNGTQVVPRARIMQFMQERGTDALREHIQAMLDDGAFDRSDVAQAVGRPATVCTESTMVIAYARVGFVLPGQQVNDLPLCLVVVTSRLNMAVLDVPRGVGTLSMPVPPGPDSLSLRSFRELSKLKWVVVNQRMRQFLGLWWDCHDSEQREVLIFDSSIRRRTFQQALRLVPKRHSERLSKSPDLAGNRLSKRQGIREVELRSEALYSIRQTSQMEAGQDNDIVNITFISQGESLAKSWGLGGHEEQVRFEMLVLTLDTITVIPLRSFWNEYAREDDADHYATCPLDGDLEETDSDGDRLPAPKSQGPVPDVTKLKTSYDSPWPLKALEGVWFLAEAEPKVKLTFGGASTELTFACETERQRWRRKLAYVLEYQETKARDTTHEDPKSAWQMVPTDKTDVSQVKNILMAERQEYMKRMAKNEARMDQGSKKKKKKQPVPALPQS